MCKTALVEGVRMTRNYTPKLHPKVLQGEVCNAKLISEPLDH